MEFIFKKSAGCEDFHEELRGLLKERFVSIRTVMREYLHENGDLSVKRKVRDSIIMYTISSIDIENEVVFIGFVGVGG